MRMLPRLLLGLTIVALAGPATALTAYLPDPCGTCQGVTGSLEIIDNGGSFSVTLTLNSDNYGGSRDGFNQVGFGAIQGWSNATLDSVPASTVTPWTDPTKAAISASGLCNTGANSDKLCISGFANITGGGDHVWKFTVFGGTLKLDEWHIGAQFADSAAPTSGQIISEDATPGPSVPEPSAALVFGLCAAVVARRSGRR